MYSPSEQYSPSPRPKHNLRAKYSPSITCSRPTLDKEKFDVAEPLYQGLKSPPKDRSRNISHRPQSTVQELRIRNYVSHLKTADPVYKLLNNRLVNKNLMSPTFDKRRNTDQVQSASNTDICVDFNDLKIPIKEILSVRKHRTDEQID